MSRGRFFTTLVLLVALLGFCLYLNRGCFQKGDIMIYHRPATRPGQAVPRRASAAAPLIFGFSQPLKLTALKVVISDEFKTNKYAKPLWELVSSSNSPSLKLIEYGVPIRGMKPKIPDARPDPLVPGTTYILFVETKDQRAQHEFTATPRPQ
jgi:hypothetical protein